MTMDGKRKRQNDSKRLEKGNSHVESTIQEKRRKSKLLPSKKAIKLTVEKTEKINPTIMANSNWLAVKNKIHQKDQPRERKYDLDPKAAKERVKKEKQAMRMKERTAEWVDNSRIVGIDCEMVGVGLSGKTSVLARCSIVDYDGNVLYDKKVRPVEKVTDFRTHVSGIKSSSLRNAIPFAQCLKEVGKIVQDKIVVGHALKNDFQALMFTPPKHLIRDTAYYRPYMRRKMNGTKLYPKSLKHLAEEVLGKHIQTGQHDSVEDARATLELYKREQYAWEKYLRANKSSSLLAGIAPTLRPTVDAARNLKSEAIKPDLNRDDEKIDTERGEVNVPDTNDLAIMEYGE
ncbi:putative ribonuclease H-like superfamily, exonuclease, RNase T/DNA polymerase III [Plasmopara halstedii]